MSDLDALAADLGKAAASIGERARAVVAKGALNIKTAMRTDASGSRHFRIARAITYETGDQADGPQALIGPEKGSPGSLANIAYFGGVLGGGGTVRDPTEPMNDEEPALVRNLELLLDEGV